MENEDLIVLGAPAETQAAGVEDSHAAEPNPAVDTTEGADTAAQPGTEQADPAAAPKPEAAKADDEDGEAGKPKKRTGITRMQEKIARLEAELASTRSAAPAASGDRAAAIEKEIGAAPKEADFDDYFAFERAQRQYDVKLALAEQRAADRETQASTRQTAARQEALDAFHDQQDEAREKIADYDKVLASAKDAKIEPHVSELVVESEKGGLLAYYLAKNPDQLEKLNRMTERQAAKAVGALESRLTLAKPKTATTAPAPAKPLAGSAAPGPDPSKMSFDEYVKYRAKPKG